MLEDEKRSDAPELASVLRRQLRKLGLTGADPPPDTATWWRLLQRISSHYDHMEENRRLLHRHMEVSTEEMERFAARLSHEQALLHQTVVALADALSGLKKAMARGHQEEVLLQAAAAVACARSEFAERLGLILRDGDGDEVLRRIGRDFEALTDLSAKLLLQTAEGFRLRDELQVAGAVQQLLLPDDAAHSMPGARVVGFHRAAATCSGDFWAVERLPSGKTLLVMGDVTGHGVAPALLTGSARAAVDLALRQHGANLSPHLLLDAMNWAIRGAGRRQLLMTAVVCGFDPAACQVTVANAGHVGPFHLMRLTEGAKVHQPLAQGVPLGDREEPTYEEIVLPVAQGDKLFLCTDGVTELENGKGEQLGERALRSLLLAQAHRDAGALREEVLTMLDNHAEDAPLVDDLTFAVLEVVGA